MYEHIHTPREYVTYPYRTTLYIYEHMHTLSTYSSIAFVPYVLNFDMPYGCVNIYLIHVLLSLTTFDEMKGV